jgi:hypothetical protein
MDHSSNNRNSNLSSSLRSYNDFLSKGGKRNRSKVLGTIYRKLFKIVSGETELKWFKTKKLAKEFIKKYL